MALELSASRTYPVPVERAFDVLLPTPLPDLFRRRYAALPPIREVRDQDGEWGTAGQTRTIVLADGGTMRETLVSVDRPRSFGYRISGISGPMKPLVSSVDGVWRLEEAGTGVRVTWAWTVHPTSSVTGLMLPLIGRMWQGYARQALGELERILVG